MPSKSDEQMAIERQESLSAVREAQRAQAHCEFERWLRRANGALFPSDVSREDRARVRGEDDRWRG